MCESRVIYSEHKILFDYNFFSGDSRGAVLVSKCSCKQQVLIDQSFIKIRPTQPKDSIRLLSSKFSSCSISRNGTIAWPPRSCDLTSLDIFVWGYIEDKVYEGNRTTILDLPRSVRRIRSDLDAATCQLPTSDRELLKAD